MYVNSLLELVLVYYILTIFNKLDCNGESHVAHWKISMIEPSNDSPVTNLQNVTAKVDSNVELIDWNHWQKIKNYSTPVNTLIVSTEEISKIHNSTTSTTTTTAAAIISLINKTENQFSSAEAEEFEDVNNLQNSTSNIEIQLITAAPEAEIISTSFKSTTSLPTTHIPTTTTEILISSSTAEIPTTNTTMSSISTTTSLTSTELPITNTMNSLSPFNDWKPPIAGLPNLPPFDLKSLPDMLQMIKLIPNVVRTLGGGGGPTSNSLPVQPNLNSFGSTGNLIQMLTGQPLASHDFLPTSSALLEAGSEYGALNTPVSNIALGTKQHRFEDRNSNTRTRDGTKLYSFNEYNEAQNKLNEIQGEEELKNIMSKNNRIPLGIAHIKPINSIRRSNIFNRMSAELPTPVDTTTHDSIPLRPKSHLMPQQRRINSVNDRRLIKPQQFTEIKDHKYKAPIELPDSSAYVAPLPAKSIPVVAQRRPKPQFDFSELSTSEVEQLETIHQKLSKTKSQNLGQNKNVEAEFIEDSGREKEEKNLLPDLVEHEIVDKEISPKLLTAEDEESIEPLKESRFDNLSFQQSQQEKTEATQEEQHLLDKENNENKTPKGLFDNGVFKNKKTGLYFVKGLENNRSQEPKESEEMTTPSMALVYEELFKNPTTQSPIQGLENINGMQPNMFSELMAIKDIPNLGELTKGLDLSLLTKPGGFPVLKQQFIQRLLQRSMAEQHNRQNNHAQLFTPHR